jgi:hypothetical protein
MLVILNKRSLRGEDLGEPRVASRRLRLDNLASGSLPYFTRLHATKIRVQG